MFIIPSKTTELVQFDCKTADGINAMPKIQAQPNVDFTLNSFGWPLNDISALNGCKSLQEYEAIACRLQQYQAQNPDTSKLSVAELIESVEPQSFQTPAEVMRFADYYGRHLQNVVDGIQAKKAQQMKSSTVTSPAVEQTVSTT